MLGRMQPLPLVALHSSRIRCSRSLWSLCIRSPAALRKLLSLCLFTFLLGSFGNAWSAPPKKEPPPPPPADADTAEQLYAKLDFESANSVAERVTKKTGLSHQDLVRVYRVLAITYAVLDKEDQSRDAFQQLLAYDPEFVVDANLGPKVSTPFSEARGYWRALPQKPGIETQVAVRVGEAGTLRITTRDPTKMVKKVNVGQRWASSGEYQITTIAVGEGVQVEVPAAPAGKTRLDYYVQALDEREDAVIEAGSKEVPKTAFAEAKGYGDKPKEKGGFIGSTTFWVIAGAVVIAGGATAGYFVLRPHDAPTSASLSPAVRCAGDLCN